MLTLSGIVPAGVTEVVVVGEDGAIVKQAAVEGQAYQLSVATEDAGAVEFRDAAGRPSGRFPIRG